MKAVQRLTTVGGEQTFAWYVECDEEEKQHALRSNWEKGLTRVTRNHHRGLAYSWMPAKPWQIAEFRDTGRMSDISEEAYFS